MDETKPTLILRGASHWWDGRRDDPLLPIGKNGGSELRSPREEVSLFSPRPDGLRGTHEGIKDGRILHLRVWSYSVRKSKKGRILSFGWELPKENGWKSFTERERILSRTE